MKISVAMATYNGEPYLEAQLQSILEQTRLPDEMVICDDGSKDRTLAILDEFAQRAGFPVRVIRNEQNLGSTKNFEKAALLCTGDAIAFVDQDDVWMPEKLARSEAALAANPKAGMVFTDALVVDQALNSLGFTMWQAVLFNEKRQQRMANGEALEILMERNVVTGATMMFLTKYRSMVVPFSETWVHDAWVAMIIALFADLAFVPEPMMLYRQHGKNQIGILFPSDQVRLEAEHAHLERDAHKVAGDIRASAREVSKPGLLKRVLRTRTRDPYRYRAIQAQFGPLVERMMALDNTAKAKKRYQDFMDFIMHMRARGYLPHNRLKRFPIVLREWVLMRYHRFSPGGMLPFGLSIALADMLWETELDEKDSLWAKHNQVVWSQAARGEFLRIVENRGRDA